MPRPLLAVALVRAPAVPPLNSFGELKFSIWGAALVAGMGERVVARLGDGGGHFMVEFWPEFGRTPARNRRLEYMERTMAWGESGEFRPVFDLYSALKTLYIRVGDSRVQDTSKCLQFRTLLRVALIGGQNYTKLYSRQKSKGLSLFKRTARNALIER
jgi:hypothetical protein